jgi:hypothetical protein
MRYPELPGIVSIALARGNERVADFDENNLKQLPKRLEQIYDDVELITKSAKPQVVTGFWGWYKRETRTTEIDIENPAGKVAASFRFNTSFLFGHEIGNYAEIGIKGMTEYLRTARLWAHVRGSLPEDPRDHSLRRATFTDINLYGDLTQFAKRSFGLVSS